MAKPSKSGRPLKQSKQAKAMVKKQQKSLVSKVKRTISSGKNATTIVPLRRGARMSKGSTNAVAGMLAHENKNKKKK